MGFEASAVPAETIWEAEKDTPATGEGLGASLTAAALLHSTAVETYVREVVEMQEPFEDDGPHQVFIDDVMAALLKAGVCPPVSAIELARTLQSDFPLSLIPI